MTVSKAQPSRPLRLESESVQSRIAKIISVLKGEITALHIRQAFCTEVAEEITASFARNSGRRERKDGVPGEYIGASHYRKDAASYLGEAENARPFVDALFGDLVDRVRGLFDALRRELRNQSIELRLTPSERGQANICRAICWSGTGAYALEPHDDVAPVLCAGSDYEISAVANNAVVALKFYPSIPEQGGK